MDKADMRKPGHVRQVIDFPLVTLVIAILLFWTGAQAAGLVVASVQASSDVGRAVLRAVLPGAFVFVIYKSVLRHLGDRPRDDLRFAGSARNLGAGLLIGFALMSLVVAVADAAGVYRIVAPGDASRLLPELLGSAIVPAFMEEMLFRGILFRWLEEFAGSWAALLVTAALFGLVHIMNPNATWFSSLAIAVEAGLLLGGAYMLTRSLWLPMGLHAAWNFTQGEIFDVPVSGIAEHGLVRAKLSGPALVSGGQFGLEASLICVVLATAVGIWFVWSAVKAGELIQPWWVRRRLAPSAV